MSSPASIKGHPIHPMLIPFPIALWGFSFFADIIHLWRGNPGWAWMAYWTMLAGCLGAVAAAIFGIIDYFAIKEREVSKIAAWHARLNVLALVLFAVSWYMRRGVDFSNPGGRLTVPFILSLVGILAITVSGYLGGELVFRHGVGVNPQRDQAAEERAKARAS